MVSVQPHAQDMVFTATQQFKDQNLQGDHRANTALWLREVDTLQEIGEETRWDLHSPSEESTESLLEEPSHYLTNLQQASPCLLSCKT